MRHATPRSTREPHAAGGNTALTAELVTCWPLAERDLLRSQELLLAMNWDVYGLLRRAGYRVSDVPASAA